MLGGMFKFIRETIRFFLPPKEWQLPVLLILGVLVGMTGFIAHTSKATSYLSEDPAACINCHVMTPQFANWQRSSHARTATCVDCHVPHDNIFYKYEFKVKDGLSHATIFTLRAEPQVIRIKNAGIAAVQANCIRCHGHVLQDVSIHQVTYKDYKEGKGKLCWECHREVPHGRVRSLSSVPFAATPERSGIVPKWLEEILAK